MNARFAEVHAALRRTMLDAAPAQTIARDLPGDLELRTVATDPKTGQSGFFGAVTVKRSYVAYHLMALYCDLALAADLSPALAQRRQGKSCFNFSRIDPALFAELGALTRRAAA